MATFIFHLFVFPLGLLYLLEVGILDVVALLTTLLTCVGTGLRTSLTAGLCIHLGAGCLEGGVALR